DPLRRARRQRHDGKRRILFAGGSEATPVGDEEIFHIVRLAVAIERRRFRIASHANSADFVAGESSGLVSPTVEDGTLQVTADLSRTVSHRAENRYIALIESEAD